MVMLNLEPKTEPRPIAVIYLKVITIANDKERDDQDILQKLDQPIVYH